MRKMTWQNRLVSNPRSRREALRLLSAAGVSVATMPMLGNMALADDEQATFFTWGGYDIPELFPSYIEKNGGTPNFVIFGETEEALTKMKAGFVPDLVHPCNNDIPRWVSTGMFQPIDTSKLKNWPHVMEALTKVEGAKDADGNQWFIPFDWGQTSITYRTDLVDWQGEEESWGLLWDDRYKGRLAVIDSVGDTWWSAAIYAGVDFNNVTPEDIEKVNGLLRKQRPLLRMYSNDTTSWNQALASGEVVAAMTWNDTPVELKNNGVPVKFADPKEGALTWVCGIMMHKDAPNPDKALEAIDALLAPAVGGFLINDYGYGHSNSESFGEVSPERLAELDLSTNPSDVLDRGVFAVPQTQELETKINRDFEDIKAGF
ncbi:MAG: extracellular solute-binding protein [Pseudomonadota bacterium]